MSLENNAAQLQKILFYEGPMDAHSLAEKAREKMIEVTRAQGKWVLASVLKCVPPLPAKEFRAAIRHLQEQGKLEVYKKKGRHPYRMYHFNALAMLDKGLAEDWTLLINRSHQALMDTGMYRFITCEHTGDDLYGLRQAITRELSLRFDLQSIGIEIEQMPETQKTCITLRLIENNEEIED